MDGGHPVQRRCRDLPKSLGSVLPKRWTVMFLRSPSRHNHRYDLGTGRFNDGTGDAGMNRFSTLTLRTHVAVASYRPWRRVRRASRNR